MNSSKRTSKLSSNRPALNLTFHGNSSPKLQPQWSTPSTVLPNGSASLDKCNIKVSYKQVHSFNYSVKKLKSLDLPDSIESVRKKKLPKEVLKPIIPRFKLENEKISLVDSKESLKEEALKEYAVYKASNEELVSEIEKYIEFLSKKAMEAGFKESEPEITLQDFKPFKSSINFDFDDKVFKNLSSSIKVNLLPGTKFIDANTYTQLIEKTLDCVADKYVELVRSSRKEQRKNMSNHKVYFDLINGFMNNSEAMIIEAQRKLYVSLGFDANKWE